MNPQESVGQDPALQKTSEFSFDEARRRPIVAARAGQKRFELLGDDLVQDSFVGLAGNVGGRKGASVRNGGAEGPRFKTAVILAR